MNKKLPLITSVVFALAALAVSFLVPTNPLLAIAPWGAAVFFLGIHHIVNMNVEPFYKLPEDDDGN